MARYTEDTHVVAEWRPVGRQSRQVQTPPDRQHGAPRTTRGHPAHSVHLQHICRVITPRGAKPCRLH